LFYLTTVYYSLLRVMTFIDEDLCIPSRTLYTEEGPRQGSKCLYM